DSIHNRRPVKALFLPPIVVEGSRKMLGCAEDVVHTHEIVVVLIGASLIAEKVIRAGCIRPGHIGKRIEPENRFGNRADPIRRHEGERLVSTVIKLRNNDRTSQGTAEPVIAHLGLGALGLILEEIVGRKKFIAKKFVGRAMDDIGSALSANVDIGAYTMPKTC